MFLKDAVLERLKDDVPEVVTAALRVLQVSEVNTGWFVSSRGVFTAACFFRCCLMFWTQRRSCCVYCLCWTELKCPRLSHGQ